MEHELYQSLRNTPIEECGKVCNEYSEELKEVIDELPIGIYMKIKHLSLNDLKAFLELCPHKLTPNVNCKCKIYPTEDDCCDNCNYCMACYDGDSMCYHDKTYATLIEDTSIVQDWCPLRSDIE